MPSAGKARPDTLRVASAFLGVLCGWWLVGAMLVVAAWIGLTSRPDAVAWLLLLLFTTQVLLAVLCVTAVRGLRRGSRTAWRGGLALFAILALQGVAILTRSPLAIPLLVLAVTGAGLLLTGSARRHLSSSVPPAEANDRPRPRRRVLVAASAAGLLAWYGFAGFNLLVATGRYRVDDRPPCDASARYTRQTATLTQWLMFEAPAQGLPIDSAEFSTCSRNFLPTVATGQISAGGVDAVRAGLEQRGCVWHDDFCTFTVKDVPAKARIHDGNRPTLELWPAS